MIPLTQPEILDLGDTRCAGLPRCLLSDVGLGSADLDRCAIRRFAPTPRDKREGPFPEAHQAPRGDEHDDEEDDADQGREARPDEADLLRVVVEDDEDEGAEPRAFEPVEALPVARLGGA